MQSDAVCSNLEATSHLMALEQRMSDVDVNDCGAVIDGTGCGALSTELILGKVRRLMLDRVAQSNEHFSRFQQRDEPDLSVENRLKICCELLDSNPGSFLTRFGSLLLDCDLVYFEQLMSDYVINFRVNELKRKLCGGASSMHRSVVRNRRL